MLCVYHVNLKKFWNVSWAECNEAQPRDLQLSYAGWAERSEAQQFPHHCRAC
jgi:hypothetical protein